ncbi:MAG: hypothetical protein CMH32_06345 [Micavibrio sp.]|nr:hypothetical protein [Micavibrio sp.]|tara:strand:- start:2338 stop:3006 length:669 start_codon:yes stop_codon:yes gene_type:complete
MKLKPLIIIVSVIVGLYLAYDYKAPTRTWRYEIAITLSTPDGDQTFSAVRQVRVASPMPLLELPQVTSSKKVKGEAVVIDIKDRPTVFAIMDQNGSHTDVLDALLEKRAAAYTPDGIRKLANIKAGTSAPLPKEHWPEFVYFEDINDPKTAQKIEASMIPFVLGENVDIKNIQITMTNKRITRKVDASLAWLESLDGSYLHGGSTSRGAPYGMHGGFFKRGE